METSFERAHPNPIELFLKFAWIGIQSFGGGSSTFILIHQSAIQNRWMSEEEFVHVWAMVQVSPGINLLKLTTMIGYQTCGWIGILAAMSGLLLPSATVTVLMTAGFTTLRNLTWIQSMLNGILPATIGLSLAMGVQMAQPQLTRAYKEGMLRLVAHLVILLGAAFLFGGAHLSPVIILLLSGVVAILFFIAIPESKSSAEKSKP